MEPVAMTAGPVGRAGMTRQEPLTRSQLLRRCLLEVGIGLVAVPILTLLHGGWRLFQDWIGCATFAGIVLAAASILAVRDYRNGIKNIRSYEEETLWGRRRDGTASGSPPYR